MDKLFYKLNAFEGPLDLLLHLIAKNKLNIYDINICELVKQYLDCINQMKEQSMDVSSDFLEMASRLVYIKSVSLLPKDEESEELKDKLSGELIEYRTVKLLSGELSKIADGFGKFIRAAHHALGGSNLPSHPRPPGAFPLVSCRGGQRTAAASASRNRL